MNPRLLPCQKAGETGLRYASFSSKPGRTPFGLRQKGLDVFAYVHALFYSNSHNLVNGQFLNRI